MIFGLYYKNNMKNNISNIYWVFIIIWILCVLFFLRVILGNRGLERLVICFKL